MNATGTLTQMGKQWRETAKLKYTHTNDVCGVSYRRQKQMSEKKDEEEVLATEVRQVVRAILDSFGMEKKAGAAVDNTAEAKEREGDEVSR